MNKNLPVNINILKWSRESIGLTIKDVANIIKKDIQLVAAWENGAESPTYSQLENLAYNVYKRPVAVFFFPEIPDEDNPKTDFRTLPSTIVNSLPPEIIKLYRKAKIFQLNIEELYEGNSLNQNRILDKFHISDAKNISNFVENIRDFLGISYEEQFSWQSHDIALKEWRELLERKGIFIFKDAFHNEDYSGFCLYDKLYPIIYINNSMPFSRQIFTVFHELAHLLFHKGGIDFRENNRLNFIENEYANYETVCNRFANEFLVPTKVFINENLIVSEKNISILAQKYSVSREVILRNFLDLKLIDNSFYKKMTMKWIDDLKLINQKKTPGGNYYYTNISYLGENYINLAFSKYYQNKISIENLSEYLNTKVKNIESFEHYVYN
ncbi:MAG: XRE family transcriptional regulator [Candidatus Margulisbacteria bacterium]|nr:XRE family transcriptional regulator [Candidatus Margulisiibacteriota bacterium]